MKAWVVEGRRRRRKRRKRRRKRKEGRHIFLGQKAVWRGRVVVSLGVARGERRLRSKWKWKGEEEEEGLSCSYYYYAARPLAAAFLSWATTTASQPVAMVCK
jgi:hypothetical protein